MTKISERTIAGAIRFSALSFLLTTTTLAAGDTVTLKYGEGDFAGIIDAAIYQPEVTNGIAGGMSIQCGVANDCSNPAASRGVIEFSLNCIDSTREIESVELMLYRKSYREILDDFDKFNENVPEDSIPSSVRELYCSDYINVRESYHVWAEYYWGDLDSAVGDLVDTFDTEDNFSPGWENYDITQVVLDSLGTERNRVNLMLKLRDEAMCRTRMMKYASDYDSTHFNEENAHNLYNRICEFFPHVRVVYTDQTSLFKPLKQIVPVVKDDLLVYALNGKLLTTIRKDDRELFPGNGREILRLRGFSRGIYLVRSRSFCERICIP